MADSALRELEESLSGDADGIIRVPFLVKGQLLFPPRIERRSILAAAERESTPGAGAPMWLEVEGAQVIRRPSVDRATLAPTGQDQLLVLPQVAPRALVEDDPSELVRGLHTLPFREVMDYVAALREALRDGIRARERAARSFNASSSVADQAQSLLFDILPSLIDPEGLAEAVDRELAGPEGPGRRYLDGWVPVSTPSQRGMVARMAERIFSTAGDRDFAMRVRAVPTRQLHITAGNSPLVPLLSFLRAIATKGAAVIKSPAEAVEMTALLAAAMRAVGADHPITRHTSLVYWKGGDRRVEDALLSPAAFDRLVVWGSPETVQSVGARGGQIKSVFLNPRYGVSLVGREAAEGHLQEAAILAATDSLIANQRACSASLVHYVEGSEEQALTYCRALQGALAGWDQAIPQRLPRATLGRLRTLRRGALLRGVWFENGPPLEPSSAVVYVPTPFDLSLHPMCRLIVVRRVDHLRQALPFLSAAVSTVGVWPETAREALRDAIAAAGVSNILPLGEGERAYAGMPHDGMRVLSELVSWTNG